MQRQKRYNFEIVMIQKEKTTTLNLGVNPDVKGRAEEIHSKLGIPMSTAIDII